MTEEKQSEYSDTQIKIATGFYIVFIIAIIVTILGLLWVLASGLLGQTKISEWFIGLNNLGFQIMIIGGLFVGLFLIIVFSFGFFKRGRKQILKWTFKAKDVDEKYRHRTEIKVIAFGFLISIIFVIIGAIILIVILIYSFISPQTPTNISTSQLCLLIGIALMILDGLCIFSINFLKNGYYFVLKLIGGLEKGN